MTESTQGELRSMLTGIKVGAEIVASDNSVADPFDFQNSLSRNPILFPLGDRVRGHAHPLRQLVLGTQILKNAVKSGPPSHKSVVVHMKDFLHYGLRQRNCQLIDGAKPAADNKQMVDTPRPEHFSAFKDWLEAVRRHRGLAKKAIAEVAGVSPQAVSKWFQGGDVEPKSLKAIADWAGAPYETLRMMLDGQPLTTGRRRIVIQMRRPIVQRLSAKIDQLADDEAGISAVEALVDSLLASANKKQQRKGVR